MIFDEATKKRFLDGYFIYDGCYGFENNRYGFLLLEKDKNKLQYRDPFPDTKFLFVNMTKPVEQRFYSVTTDNFDFSTISIVTNSNGGDFLVVDTSGFVFSWDNDFEIKIDNNIPNCNFISAITKTVRVGSSVYALGGGHRIYKRIGLNNWLDNSETLPVPQDFIDDTASTSYCFIDLSGFSEVNMYAVGDVGSVFHFDGKIWNQISFPTNVRLATVTCAGDEQVYITDKNCSVWVGRDSTWKKLVEEDMSLSFFDSAWFDGRMWFTNDYGIWVLENDKLILAKNAQHKPIPEEAAVLCGRLDVSPDNQRMLVCGQNGAAVYDGQQWSVLFTCN